MHTLTYFTLKKNIRIDFVTLGYLPLIDTAKALSIGVACVPALQDIVCETVAQCERKLLACAWPVLRRVLPCVRQYTPHNVTVIVQAVSTAVQRLLFSAGP